MFSRALSLRTGLVRGSLLARSRGLVPMVSTQINRDESVRTFKSSPVLKSAAPAEPANSLSGNIEKYGSLAFWGSIAAIAVTKEIFIIDAETLLGLEIGAFCLAGYVICGDTIEKMNDEADQKKTDQFVAANDFMIEMFNQYKMIQSNAQNKPAVMEEYLAEYKAAIEAHAAYKTIAPQHEARAKVIAALEAVKSKEEHSAAMEWEDTIETAVANVYAAFEEDNPELQQEMIEMAINNIGYDPVELDEDEDPVKRLFLAEFEADEDEDEDEGDEEEYEDGDEEEYEEVWEEVEEEVEEEEEPETPSTPAV